MEICGILGAKKTSERLPGKGWRDFGGKPMYIWNTEKGLSLCDRMYVSSDYDYILEGAEAIGAIPIKRTDPKLMSCPNITWYRYCMQFMNGCDILIAL
jgi:CMP-N-acetylneuraminic acid synthetase